MKLKVRDGEVLCGWFHTCDNIAGGYVEHSLLGPVPTCERCAKALDLDRVVADVQLEGS